LKLLASQLDKGAWNGQAVSIGGGLDQGVQKAQITLKGPHVAAESCQPLRLRRSRRAVDFALKFTLYSCREVLYVSEEGTGRAEVGLRAFLLSAILADEIDESIED
jgi:hypothetical protein